MAGPGRAEGAVSVPSTAPQARVERRRQGAHRALCCPLCHLGSELADLPTPYALRERIEGQSSAPNALQDMPKSAGTFVPGELDALLLPWK